MRWSTFTLLPKYFMRKIIRSKHNYHNTFKYEDIQIFELDSSLKAKKPNIWELKSRSHFCDHMLKTNWNSSTGWSAPQICPVHDLMLHPASKVLHYCQTIFEGFKAFRAEDNRLLLFRPEAHINRMLQACSRAVLPTFDSKELLQCIKKLIYIDRDWLLNYTSVSLYVRLLLFATESSLSAKTSNTAQLIVISSPTIEPCTNHPNKVLYLIADNKCVRSWPRGTGNFKMGSNYASTLYYQRQAEKRHFQQVLWLFGDENRITEISNMNVFILWLNDMGEKELITPPLDGLILPGITRDSVLKLAEEWNELKISEKYITMNQLLQANKRNHLLEAFGTGTDHGICPIRSIFYQGFHINFPAEYHKSRELVSQRIIRNLVNIKLGKTYSEWMVHCTQ